MRLVRNVLFWILAASWLPATLHCAVEQAGILRFTDACCEEQSEHSPLSRDHCESDPCEILESGLIKQSGDLAAVTAPAVTVGTHFALLLCESRRLLPRVSPDTTDSPPELAGTWQFAARAALPSRAPDLAS